MKRLFIKRADALKFSELPTPDREQVLSHYENMMFGERLLRDSHIAMPVRNALIEAIGTISQDNIFRVLPGNILLEEEANYFSIAISKEIVEHTEPKAAFVPDPDIEALMREDEKKGLVKLVEYKKGANGRRKAAYTAEGVEYRHSVLSELKDAAAMTQIKKEENRRREAREKVNAYKRKKRTYDNNVLDIQTGATEKIVTKVEHSLLTSSDGEPLQRIYFRGRVYNIDKSDARGSITFNTEDGMGQLTIPKSGLYVIFSKPNKGKTYLAQSIAAHVDGYYMPSEERYADSYASWLDAVFSVSEIGRPVVVDSAQISMRQGGNLTQGAISADFLAQLTGMSSFCARNGKLAFLVVSATNLPEDKYQDLKEGLVGHATGLLEPLGKRNDDQTMFSITSAALPNRDTRICFIDTVYEHMFSGATDSDKDDDSGVRDIRIDLAKLNLDIGDDVLLDDDYTINDFTTDSN